jgi:hypothetical protein
VSVGQLPEAEQMTELLPGRPKHNHPAVQQQLYDALANGATRAAAAQKAGISKETFYQWCRAFPDFVDLVHRAEAEAELKALAAVTSAFSGDRTDWRAGAWWLERRRRAEYGQQIDLRAIPIERLTELVAGAEDEQQSWPTIQALPAGTSMDAQTTASRDTLYGDATDGDGVEAGQGEPAG